MNNKRKLLRGFVRLLLLSYLAWSGVASAAGQPERILHILDYVSIDYREAVSAGAVMDAAEYAEQQEFAGQVKTLVAALAATEAKPRLAGQATELAAAIDRREPAERIAGLAGEMKRAVISAYPVSSAPTKLASAERAATLYRDNCASCHGVQGAGDGAAGAGLDPAPSNFLERERQFQRSVFGSYNTISLGVDGTGMPGFTQLAEDERWALAYYVGTLPMTAAERERGRTLWADGRGRDWFPSPEALSLAEPAKVAAIYGADGLAVLAYLRSEPQALIAAANGSPMQIATQRLQESLSAYREGRARAAYDLAVAAYLEGFEQIEAALDNVDHALRLEVEESLTDYRRFVKEGRSVEEVTRQAERTQTQLTTVEDRLGHDALSPTVTFLSSLGVLFREGLEAILILAAMVAVLGKAGRRDALRYVHAGWMAALVAGGLTWVLASYVLNITAASREVTEGLTALLAAAILFYASFWMLNKVHGQQWKVFIEQRLRRVLDGRGGWLLGFVAFIAVYREIFETILFYQALWMQAGPNGSTALLGGMAVGAIALAAIAALILRLSVRLPLKLFFTVNSALLYVLAVVFAGKGVAALQEAGMLPISPVAFTRVELLGIYPNAETLLTQGALIALALGSLVYLRWTRRHQGRTAAT